MQSEGSKDVRGHGKNVMNTELCIICIINHLLGKIG